MHRPCLIALLSLVLAAGCADDAPSQAPQDAAPDAPMTSPPADMPADLGMPSVDQPLDLPPSEDLPADMPPQDAPDDLPPVDWDAPLGGERPARVVLPDDFDPNTPLPLLVLLHGYGSTASTQSIYFGASVHVREEGGFILLLPEGRANLQGVQYWNATDACCDYFNAQTDDEGYLADLITQALDKFNVDEERVFLLGHSNGGFMAHRMACRRAELITGIISLAGPTFEDEADCAPARPVSLLQVHGTGDVVVGYSGGNIYTPSGFLGPRYPGAQTTVDRWVAHNGCDPTPSATTRLDLDIGLFGDDTDAQRWSGCDDGAEVALWRINFGLHVPTLTSSFLPDALGFISATRRTP